MALNAYMAVRGQKQGPIKGSVTVKGREDQIAVHAVSHEIVTPRDPASGLPTGQRMHKPFVVTKDIDRSSPLLFNALVGNEKLTDVRISFYRPAVKSTSGTGSEEQHYTITLTNAAVAGLQTVQPDNNDPGLAAQPGYEVLSLVYERITWTWNDGGIAAEDTWVYRQ